MLTPRQGEVLALLLEGLGTREVADALQVCEATVRSVKKAAIARLKRALL